MLAGKIRVTIYILQQSDTDYYIMQTTMPSKPTTRVPVPLTDAERKRLKQLATKEIRSESAMARIIYLLGVKQLSEKK
jgi:hypothetical protein